MAWISYETAVPFSPLEINFKIFVAEPICDASMYSQSEERFLLRSDEEFFFLMEETIFSISEERKAVFTFVCPSPATISLSLSLPKPTMTTGIP